MAKKTQTVPRNFEEALAELERILGDIEGGHVGLEESLSKYERGAFLLQHCRNVLDSAEKQIELLSRTPDGSLRIAPLPATASGNPAQSLPSFADTVEGTAPEHP